MVIAQAMLVAPIIAALARQTIEDLWVEYRDELTAMDVGPLGRVATLIWDARFSLVTALLAGFGRAAAEVGAVMIVGGNIDGFTRTMTTAIALETSKGDLPLAIGLGMVLIAIVDRRQCAGLGGCAAPASGWRDDHARARRPICRSCSTASRVAARRRDDPRPHLAHARAGAPTVLIGPNGAGQDHAAADRHGADRADARARHLGRPRARRRRRGAPSCSSGR